MTEEHDRPDVEEHEHRAGPYVPPTAEDIDTSHEPAEAIAGANGSVPKEGPEGSERWH